MIEQNILFQDLNQICLKDMFRMSKRKSTTRNHAQIFSGPSLSPPQSRV